MDTAFEDLCITDRDRKNWRRMDKRKKIDQEDNSVDREFISKNLEAERRRRKKLNDRQLELRSLVPIITNMNKATIITDAIAYIEELRNSVEELTDQILQMEATDEVRNTKFEDININDDDHQMKIAPEVEVNHICGTKIWIKIIVQKKRGRLTKLMEAISVIGFHLTDISITTSQQAILFTSSAEGVHGGVQDADQIKKFLLEIIRSI
ncbi:hypothetical protein ABFS82_13G117900 [Erythranthe guttata]|uniref:transcription factor DYT1-like n=1 Tax=Erythranthe guttata TaxID=4155 RepID=UPI00064DB976|nr:PREDICTED: transcription factor DYT1-like [Erythranthe guttata]|eukprot:XP_012848643.1 PREDICTED: transcription factor DYT1-like [Erythranthe guttata]